MFAFLLLFALGNALKPNPSYGMHNFYDMTMSWCANVDSSNYKGSRPAGICQLRWNNNGYKTNLLQGDGFVYKVGSKSYSDPFKFVGKNTIEYPGEYTFSPKYYNLNTINDGVSITKRHLMVPEKHILLEAYDITNTGSSSVKVNLMDYVNSSTISSNIQGGYDSTTKALYFNYANDASYSNSVVVAGMYNVDTVSLGDSLDFTPVDYFNTNDALDGTTSKTATSMMGGFQKVVTIAAGATTRVTVYRGLATSVSAAQSLASEIVSKTYDQWLATLKTYSDNKFANYKTPSFANDDEKQMWYSSVFTVLFSQNPTFGTLLASYHPLYSYKVWSRDAVFSSIIMIALGEKEGAKKFLNWLGSAELRDGSYFPTCYDWFTGSSLWFVEPQYDAMGLSLVAYYYYYTQTKDSSLLKDATIKNRITQIENFLLTDDFYGMIKPDYSIWEESSNGWTGNGQPTSYFVFSNALAHHGLLCAAKIQELIYGDSSRAATLRTRASQISTGFENMYWNEDAGHYVQALWNNANHDQNVVIDSSTVAAIWSGMATNQERIKKHMDKIRSDLTKLDYGIARYYNDPYFYQSKFNPAGQEVQEASPPWGVTTMFVAMTELLIDSYDGHANMVPNRLQWMIDHTGPDFIPAGEAIDGVSGDPAMASMPDVYEHAGVYILVRLQYQGLAPLFNYEKW